MSTVRLARVGAWTPWASVLCAECDYAALKDSDRARHYARHLGALSTMTRTAEVPCPDGDALATCDTCHCSCWVRDDVALLQRVGFRSSDLDWKGPFGWALEQTGGMCAALVFSTEHRQVVVTAMDGMFLVGEYERGGEESWSTPLRTWESTPFCRDDEMRPEQEIELLVDECARNALHLVRTGLATAHEAAAGARCHPGDDGLCVDCGVEMTACNVCHGVGYHRAGCRTMSAIDLEH